MSTIIKEYIDKDTSDKNRLFVDFECDNCRSVHKKQKRFMNGNNFCSHNCMGEHKKLKYSTKYDCSFCKKEIFRNPSKQQACKSGLFFCSKHCRNEAQKIKHGITDIWPSHYGTSNGLSSYRDWALDEFPHKCNNCGYDKYLKLLHVHHIDENRENNKLENLELLCPTCHLEKHLINASGPYTYSKDL